MQRPDFPDRAQSLYDTFEEFVAWNPYLTSIAFGDTLYFEVGDGQINPDRLVDPEAHAFMGTAIGEAGLAPLKSHSRSG